MKRIMALLAGLLASAAVWGADTRSYEDFYGTVEIPAEPQRIVSLQDHVLTMTLLELGASVVGSVGRTGENGQPYLRGVKDLLGVNFDNSDIEYLGWTDIEKVVAVEPDLIITNNHEEEGMLEKLRAIAPTVAVNGDLPVLDLMRATADAGGVLDEYEARLDRYHSRIDEARAIIPDAEDISVSIVLAHDGRLRGFEDYGALSQVINDIGFDRPEAVSGIGYSAEFSAESLPELDADFVIDTYRVSAGDTPEQARERMAEVLPQWCDVWHACRNNQYLVFPRTFVFSSSFSSLELATQLLVTHVGGRDFVPYKP